MTYWTVIPWLTINGNPAPYPVLNERAIRATAWVMMLLWFITFMIVYTTKDFTYMYPVVILFWLQFFIAVVWWTKYAPMSIIWSWFVAKQQPEYVWAIQKRFAWSLGLAMATAMMIVVWWFGMIWVVPFVICWTCLILMRMESALWICVWCKIYYWLVWANILKKPDVAPACPWWACTVDFTKKSSS